MSRYNLAWLITVPLLMLVCVTLSFSAPNRDRDKEYKLVRTIVDVLAEVDQHYVKPLDDKQKEQLVENMINGGLEKLDPYSQYLNADDLKLFNASTEGNFGGIGVHMGVDLRTGFLTVISPMVGTPAYEAGVLAGDIITKINDKPTDNMSQAEAIKLIQGEPGTPLTLTVLHEGTREAETLHMKRAEIKVDSVLGFNRKADNLKEWDWYVDAESRIGYIRVLQFSDKTTEEIKTAVERMEKEGAKGLVIDMRDNPGGLLDQAIQTCDLFLKSGRIVSTKNRNGVSREHDAKEGEIFAGKPIAILLNRNSASASEVVAAALQDNGRATLVGERSYGKGSVQKVIRMNGDPPTALKLTTDTYWRPSGANIHRYPDSKETDEWGVKPNEGMDIVMKDDERLEYLRAKRNKDIIRKEKIKESPFVDRMLDKAIEHLKAK